MKRSKRYSILKAEVDRDKEYSLTEAIQKVKKAPNAKFDETIELSINLGINARRADQNVRGTVSLPHGTGKTVRVLVLTKGPKEKEAEDAGADFVGFEEYIEKIKSGWIDFDAVIATPDSMREVGKLGRILGPRGLMPNPKTGTVTMDIGNAVQAVKAGKIEIRIDKFAILHSGVGRKSFSEKQLEENVISYMTAVQKLKPAAAKGTYIKKITVSSTMGPGIKLDRTELMLEVQKSK